MVPHAATLLRDLETEKNLDRVYPFFQIVN